MKRVKRSERSEATPETLRHAASASPDWRTRLSADELEAADAIRAACRVVAAGTGARIARWERGDRGQNSHETTREVMLQLWLNEWVDALNAENRRRQGRDPWPTFSILCAVTDGLSEQEDTPFGLIVRGKPGRWVPYGAVEAALRVFVKVNWGR